MALEGRPPVPGRCTGLRTAPARIRDGTQGIAKPKGGSYCRLWVEFRGWAAAGFIFGRANGRTEDNLVVEDGARRAARLATGK